MTNPNHSAQAGIGVQAPERSKIQFSKKLYNGNTQSTDDFPIQTGTARTKRRNHL